MHPSYFLARFRVDEVADDWPEKFVILSAWATTGESWSHEQNEAADRELAETLAARGLWRRRILGYSPVTGHTEPSWAFPMSLDEACDLGQQFQQDALYYIQADQLSVTHCDHRRSLVPVGAFRERVEVKDQPGSKLLSKHWRLNPDVDFLNHGSFGAAPTVVLEAQRHWILQMEREPVEFLAPERSLLPKLDQVRASISSLIHAPVDDLVFVRNATEGVNAVLRSFPFDSGDEVLITSHGYNACNNAARFAAERAGATVSVAELPFPIDSPTRVVDAVEAKLNARTRLLLIDHVTSPTGLVLPVEEIVQLAHRHGTRVMIDGAHAPGMLPLDLGRINPDYYTANHHKWLCGPKTSGLLYVRAELQSEVRPTTISHGANTAGYGVSRFQGEFNWIGTSDPSPILAMPTAIQFLSHLHDGGLNSLMAANRAMVLAGRDLLLGQLSLAEPAPAEMIGSLASIPLPNAESWSSEQFESLQQQLFRRHRIEVPLFRLSGQQACIRISAQAYNSLEQYERLAAALGELLGPSGMGRL